MKSSHGGSLRSSSILESRGERRVGELVAAVARYSRTGVRSRCEAAAFLRRRGASAGLAAQVLAECRRCGLVDDRACAQLWADHWARRGYAWSAIRLKLADKGLDEEAIARAGQRAGMASDDGARARQLVASRARTGSGARQRVRLARALAARGYDAELIEQVLDESLGPV